MLTRTEDNSANIKAKVVSTHKAEADGFIIINGSLKITPNHILRVNGNWVEAGSIQSGDKLTDFQGNEVLVDSIEWQRGKYSVYNLEVETYHTFFADGVWVHNEKGVDRNVFRDTAYWNPSLHTDSNGRAKVSFTLPDNLTTWTLAAVGSTLTTQVGQTTDEIVVSKDVIVRPVLPNILRLGDTLFVSALVQNFTQNDHKFDISLEFDSGEVDSAKRSNVLLESSRMEQVFWKIKPTKETEHAKLIFSAKSTDGSNLADVVTQEISVKDFGFEETRAETGEGEKTYLVDLVVDANKDKSSVTLSLSSTLIGTLPSAMRYLIQYPYGCVEQTTSRFVPAVIAKTHPTLFADALKDKDVNDIIAKSLTRLTNMQHSDGGWSWWSSGNSDPFITAYVVEYLLEAQKAGVRVDPDLLSKAKRYFEQENYYNDDLRRVAYYSKEEKIAKNYGLTLLGAKDKVTKIPDLTNTTPDILSLAVMTNYLNGDKNSQSNGLDLLISLAQTQGDALFWKNGVKANFGSNDASTALAIRTILLANGDRDLAAKGARYLTRTRQSNYWSNTFATSQVIRALVDLADTGNELTPNYTYTVLLDGTQIAQGSVTASTKIIQDIVVPITAIKDAGSQLALTTTGDGQLYSTLVINEFNTDRNASAKANGLTVTRDYINEKGSQYSLGVGDTALVTLTVSGLKADEYYGVIKDELPSGLVPINQTFKNEQYGSISSSYYYSRDVTDREITENGIVLSLYKIASGNRTYTYKARVVSEGTFIVPPATASLMYAPEIYGRSGTQILKVTKESELIPWKAPKQAAVTYAKQASTISTWLLVGLLVVIGVIVVPLVILNRRGVSFSKIKEKLSQVFKRKNTLK
ncbi:MAG: hypothetical protein ACD_22C00118G0004 [uncultured bacterium]|nr:MAG: hypothetical protein ACD_22C00118G0004 [uncultured bacterium]